MTAHEKITAQHKGIYAALAAAQMQMGPALKSANNPAFRTKYADLASVMEACMPALNGNGIAVFQPTCEVDGARYVKTVLAHEGGETLECLVPLIVGKNDMQGYGSAVTYARRYGLMSMAGIAPEDDDGNAASKSPPVTEPTRRHMPHERGPGPADIAAESLKCADSLDQLAAIWRDLPGGVKALPEVIGAKDNRKAELTKRARDTADADEIPY